MEYLFRIEKGYASGFIYLIIHDRVLSVYRNFGNFLNDNFFEKGIKEIIVSDTILEKHGGCLIVFFDVGNDYLVYQYKGIISIKICTEDLKNFFKKECPEVIYFYPANS